MDFQKIMFETLENIGFPLSEGKVRQLEAHYKLMISWDNQINLTSIRNPKEAVVRHYIDSLLGGQCVSEEEFYDFGTGAGFPGLILGVAHPERKVILVEPLRKRCAFLKRSVSELGLKNIQIYCDRVESLQTTVKTAISRATFSEDTLSSLAGKMERNGKLYLWRSEVADNFAQKLKKNTGMTLLKSSKYTLPDGVTREIAVCSNLD